MDVTVFSSAGCGKCVATKAALRSAGVPFTEVRIDQLEDEDAKNAVATAGALLEFKQLPIVMAFRSEDDEVPDVWSDFHPDLVKSLKAA